MAKLVIRHDLHTLDAAALAQYLRDVSEFIGLDPDLNALDAIWMPNESGVGQSLVVYMRRGTAEILRNKLHIEVDALASEVIDGSIVFTAKGHIDPEEGVTRHEIAIGSKYIRGLEGKAKDDAIMTASTRALRRLTAQFTTLGLLDESEVNAVKNEAVTAPNPAGQAALAPNPMPAVFTQPSVPANNAPGKPVDPKDAAKAPPIAPEGVGKPLDEQFLGQQNQIDAAMAQVTVKQAAKQVDTKPVEIPVTPVESTVASDKEAVKKADKPKRARKTKNTVALDVEPETVSGQNSATSGQAAPPQVNPAVPTQVHSVAQNPPSEGVSLQVAAPSAANVENKLQEQAAAPQPLPGAPSKEQMDGYRARIGVFTTQLPASNGMGSVQKMRAFMTRYNNAAPQNMTAEQYEKTIAFLEQYTNNIPGLVAYINLQLGLS